MIQNAKIFVLHCTLLNFARENKPKIFSIKQNVYSGADIYFYQLNFLRDLF